MMNLNNIFKIVIMFIILCGFVALVKNFCIERLIFLFKFHLKQLTVIRKKVLNTKHSFEFD